MTIHDTENCWEAQYKRRAVRVRSLQVPQASDRAIKVLSYYLFVRGYALIGYDRNFAMRPYSGGD